MVTPIWSYSHDPQSGNGVVPFTRLRVLYHCHSWNNKKYW